MDTIELDGGRGGMILSRIERLPVKIETLTLIPPRFLARLAGMVAFLLLGLSSCGSKEQESETRVISVSPYQKLPDRELNSRYMTVLDELESLKNEMKTAIAMNDRAEVHACAGNILAKAREARVIASHFDDPAVRSRRVAAADELIPGLEEVVELTREPPPR